MPSPGLPPKQGRWGQWHGMTFLAQWLPVVAFYDATGWHNPIPIKKACELLGLCGARLRLPLVEADEERTAAVRAALENHGVLQTAA